MGSSKTANALMTKFNYEEKGYLVALFKPAVDKRDGETTIVSRIGLRSEGDTIPPEMNMLEWWSKVSPKPDCIIVDECQFLTEAQIDELKAITIDIPVLCYGLRTDFMSHLFAASKRLFEIADSITEIKSVCKCGKKAIINARYEDGKIIYNGNQIDIGGNEKYVGLCYECWKAGKI